MSLQKITKTKEDSKKRRDKNATRDTDKIVMVGPSLSVSK